MFRRKRKTFGRYDQLHVGQRLRLMVEAAGIKDNEFGPVEQPGTLLTVKRRSPHIPSFMWEAVTDDGAMIPVCVEMVEQA